MCVLEREKRGRGGGSGEVVGCVGEGLIYSMLGNLGKVQNISPLILENIIII